jgi:hypothetical protein
MASKVCFSDQACDHAKNAVFVLSQGLNAVLSNDIGDRIKPPTE